MKQLAKLLLLFPLLPQLLFEIFCHGTGLAILRALSRGRIRVRGESEPDAHPFNLWWRDADSIVVSDGTPAVIGMIFWISVLVAAIIAYAALIVGSN